MSIDISQFRRIALIADTHGAIHPQLLPTLLKYDCIIHAGDIGSFGGLGLGGVGMAEVPFFAVQGNNDIPAKWPPNEAVVKPQDKPGHNLEENPEDNPRDYQEQLNSLPETLTLSCLGGTLAVIHGHQFPSLKTRHEKLRAQFPNVKAVVYGHSHRAVIDKSAAPWVLNPGAAGSVRAHDGAGFIGLTVSQKSWRIKRISRS